VTPYFESIYNAKFSIDWFSKFDIILNALDNLPARRFASNLNSSRHVNMMACAAGIPLIESGTAGYLGQVTVHTSTVQCFDCEPKPTPKTFPVCTIRSTPSLMLHCIVWGKTWLMGALFSSGASDEGEELDSGDAGEKELENLKSESSEMKDLRAKAGSPEYARLVFEKIFGTDVVRLVGMTELWKDRDPPVPLVYPVGDVVEVDEKEREQGIWSYEYTCKVRDSFL
jgi:ubiquitin-like 1-activating enzyme E1 B